eukprot:3859837-Pleurochrysis_carterae.AAC.3
MHDIAHADDGACDAGANAHVSMNVAAARRHQPSVRRCGAKAARISFAECTRLQSVVGAGTI